MTDARYSLTAFIPTSITSSGGSIILFPAKYTRFKLVHSSRYVPNLIVL